MKCIRLIATCLLAFSARALATTITFGTDDYTVTTKSSTFSVTSQTSSSLTLSGSAQSDLFGVLTNSLNLSAYDFSSTIITLSASITSASTASFIIELFDAEGDGVKYQGGWSSFTSTLSSSTLTLVGYDLTKGGTFDATNITSIALYGGGGTTSLNITLDSLILSTVPEPSYYVALAGAATLGFAGWHRRRRLPRA